LLKCWVFPALKSGVFTMTASSPALRTAEVRAIKLMGFAALNRSYESS
jgi:hypothetical protein